MRILVANDDGVYSPGIAALAEVAAEFGETRIVAPDVEMSSAGHSITAARPLSYKRTPNKNVEAYRVNGTPADCVALGVSQWEKVDVVLSGINLGSNLGKRDLALGHARSRQAGRAHGTARNSAQHTRAQGRAGFRGAKAVGARGAEGAARGNHAARST